MMGVFHKNNMMKRYIKIGKQQFDSFSDKDLQVLAIFREMMSGSALDPQMIKMKMLLMKNMLQCHKTF